MPHLRKIFWGDGHASKFVCPRHLSRVLDEPYNTTIEGPWEVLEDKEDGEGLPCEVEGCDRWSPFEELSVVSHRVTLRLGPYPGLTFNMGRTLPSAFRIPTLPMGAYVLASESHHRTGLPSYLWVPEAIALNVEVIAPFGGV